MSEDEHIVVVGGASGVGLAVAERLLDRGASVTIVDLGGEEMAAAEDLLDGEDVMFVSADITDEDEIADGFDAATDEFGPLSGLVNAGGIKHFAAIEDTSVERFRQIVDVNLTGAFITSLAALDRMGDSLAIVNISSVSGARPSAGQTAYGASKAGLMLMSQAMAVELGASGIRVNVVAMGAVETDLIADTLSVEEKSRWMQSIPQQRYGRVDEIAEAVLFLLSDKAGYINGQVLAVDGGFLPAGLIRLPGT